MLDVCSATVFTESQSARRQKNCLKKPHKKRYASDSTSTSAAGDGSSAPSDASSLEASLSAVGKFCSGFPKPCFARKPVDALEELSSHLMMGPANQGRLFWFLKTYAILAKQSSFFIAKGVMELPDPDSPCYEPFSKLVLPREKASRRAAKREVCKRLELPEVTVHGTPEDDKLRTTYSYVMAFFLQQMIQANDAMGMFSLNTAFSCPHNKVPSISLLLFIQRVMRYLPATKELYIVAMIYIDRVLAFNSDICFTLFNAHRLFISAILIASKFLDDLFYTNVFVSKVAGVSAEELNRLEIEFLAAIRFSLYVQPEVYQCYADNFNQLVAVCNMLPLDAVVTSAPCHCSPLIRSSYSVVDEMFLHFESERQRIIATPVKPRTFAEPSMPSTLKSLYCRSKCSDDASVNNEDSSLTVVVNDANAQKSSRKTSPVSLKRPSAVLSSCSTEASCYSSYNSSSSSWSSSNSIDL